ncbi:hypothetical protein SEUCBS139899_001686 [Sporothrix eucalyptigena]|uniref:Carboxylic ester hydrolase n=1 Tax=Sporothrix eucalyptigena TaxID=1812306 RepID=A0ABP0ASP7_9PEZI
MSITTPTTATPTTQTAVERAAVVQLRAADGLLQTVVGMPCPRQPQLEQFLGIPYGDIPGRWQHSTLRTSLPQDIFHATQNGPKCPQPPSSSRTYQAYLPFPPDELDEFRCANLFVMRPSAAALAAHGFATDAQLPVLFWMHGGGFIFGAATHPMWEPSGLVARALARRTPIVAVFVNYRLNVFGFAGGRELLEWQTATRAPGTTAGINFGLRDQKVALAWVSRNIAAFGGDPARITIGGQSAGSVSVHTHVIEALGAAAADRGPPAMFRRAIMQSGALGTLGPQPLDKADARWNNLCAQFNLDDKQADRVELIRRVPTADLLSASGRVPGGAFPPALDGITMRNTTAPTAGPQQLAIDLGPMDLGNAPPTPSSMPIDVLLGVTESEGSVFSGISPSWEQISGVFGKAYGDNKAERDAVLAAYGFSSDADQVALRQGLVDFFGDSMFGVPVQNARHDIAALQRSGKEAGSAANVYSFHAAVGNPFPGPLAGLAHHCSELVYLFGAFAEPLAAADAGRAVPFQEPGQSESGKSAVVAADGAMVEGNKEKKDVEALADVDAGINFKASNVEFSRQLMDRWLDYVTADDLAPSFGHPGVAGTMTVLGRNREIRHESLANDPAWQALQARWGTGLANVSALGRATDGMMGLFR